MAAFGESALREITRKAVRCMAFDRFLIVLEAKTIFYSKIIRLHKDSPKKALKMLRKITKENHNILKKDKKV